MWYTWKLVTGGCFVSDVRHFRFEADKKPRDFSPKFKNRDEICGLFFAGMCRGASPRLIAAATSAAKGEKL